MIKMLSHHLLIFMMVMTPSFDALSQMKTVDFSFNYDSINYSGFIDFPNEGNPSSIIILIPGSGETNFLGEGGWFDWYYKLRLNFSQQGFAVCAWDRAGCGESGGKFNEHQPVQSSAKEALAAIAELRNQNITGSDRIGLWGISRGGWICPLVVHEDSAIAFWISVSGADQFDNYRYFLESNFRIEGRSESQTKALMNEWDHRLIMLRKGGETYEEYINATETLFQDPFYISIGGKRLSEMDFYQAPAYYENSVEIFDEETGLQILVPNFEQSLNKVECPVLAIFGEKDSQIDWRKTEKLYRKAIGKNSKSKLDVKILPNCNHLIMKCETGGKFENLEKFNWEVCEGYYAIMNNWLIKQRLTE